MARGACRSTGRRAEGAKTEVVSNELNTLLTALYVELDDRVLPRLGCSRTHRRGRKPALTDAELLCLVVAQQLLGVASERRWIRYARTHLAGMFPRLPGQQLGQQRPERRRAAILVRPFGVGRGHEGGALCIHSPDAR